jgi:hypothetical protein
LDWYSDEFVPGERYMDADGQFTLEYAGRLTAKTARGLVDHPEFVVAVDPNESVHIFVVVAEGGRKTMLYTHTKVDADRGYCFVRLSDKIHEDT